MTFERKLLMRRTITLIILLIAITLPVCAVNLYLPDSTDKETESTYWQSKPITNNYGDITDWAVSTTFDGTFSNSVTQSSSFTGELVITKTYGYFTIREYGRALATGYGTTDRYYLSFGNARVEMYLSTDGRFVVSTKETQAIINELARLSTGGEIGVRISGGKYGNTTYIGSIEAKGFGKEAGNIITTTQAEVEAERQKRIDNNFAFAGTFSISVMGNKMGFYGYLARNKSIGFSIGFFGYEPFQDRKINIKEYDGFHLGITYPFGDEFIVFAGGELGAGWGISAGLCYMHGICISGEVSYNFKRNGLFFSLGIGLGGWNLID